MTTDIRNIPVSWVIVPAPWRVNAPPGPAEQKWLMTLSGIADISFRGNSTAAWRHETFRLFLNWRDPVSLAYGGSPPAGHTLFFQPEQWSQFAAISSIYNAGQSLEAGYAVDSCDVYLSDVISLSETGGLQRTFAGLKVVVGVRDTDAYLSKISFQVTLLGKIALLAP